MPGLCNETERGMDVGSSSPPSQDIYRDTMQISKGIPCFRLSPSLQLPVAPLPRPPQHFWIQTTHPPPPPPTSLFPLYSCLQPVKFISTSGPLHLLFPKIFAQPVHHILQVSARMSLERPFLISPTTVTLNPIGLICFFLKHLE